MSGAIGMIAGLVASEFLAPVITDWAVEAVIGGEFLVESGAAAQAIGKVGGAVLGAGISVGVTPALPRRAVKFASA